MADKVATTESTIFNTVTTSSTTNTKPSTLRFKIDQQCPIQYVTVYNDRAEITRLVQHHFNDDGIYDLVFEGFSPFVDQKSLHVSGGTSNACTILEVSYQTYYANVEPQEDLTPLDQLKNEFNKIEADIDVHQREVIRFEKQLAWVDGRASKLMNQDGQVNADNLSSIQEFMDFYYKTLLKLDDQKANEQDEIKRLKEQRDDLQAKITRHGIEGQLSRRKECREVTVTVYIGNRNVDVSLEISYLINNCSWSASYDVRVSSAETSNQRIQLTYHGIIVSIQEEYH